MLRYITMNIFDSPAQTLVNAVNTVGIMGKGIAAEYKQRYPEMFRKYRQFCTTGDLTIGKLYLYKSPNKWVLNFPTKKHWRNPSTVEYVEAGLQKFVDTYSDYGITSISFPQLGTGNGGLDWPDVVLPLMQRYLKPLPIPVYIHVARTPADFVPEHLDKSARRAIRAPRVGITLLDFLHDVSELAELTTPRETDGSEEKAFPLFRVADGVEIPGEELESLWQDLRLRGAVAVDDFPPTIAAHANLMTGLLLQLGYIRPIRFAQSVTDAVEGIRFAPREDTVPASSSSMFAERESASH